MYYYKQEDKGLGVLFILLSIRFLNIFIML